MFEIKKATKEQSRLRMSIHGPAGSGKTFTALKIATAMCRRVCLIDTECGSASKYADEFSFDVLEVGDDFSPERLIDMLAHIAKQGFDGIVIDSLTHFWNGSGGFLELVDREVARMRAKGNKPDSFAAWKVVDPVYKRMIHAIHTNPAHEFITIRAKTEYAKVEGDNGRTKIQKLGMAPEIRENFQYEMDVEGMLDIEHHLSIGKTRCAALDGRVFQKAGSDIAGILTAWLTSGAPAAPRAPTEFERLGEMFNAATSEEDLAALREAVNVAFKAQKVTKDETGKLVELNRSAAARIAETQAAE